MDLIGVTQGFFKGGRPSGNNARMEFKKGGEGFYSSNGTDATKAAASLTMDAQADGVHSVVLQKQYGGMGKDVLYLSGNHNFKVGDRVNAIDDQRNGRQDLGNYKVVFAD